MSAPRYRPLKSCTCRVCGCTDERACEGGCYWIDAEQTLCSSCAGTAADLAYSLEWITMLRLRHGARESDVIAATINLADEALKRFAKRLRAQRRRKV